MFNIILRFLVLYIEIKSYLFLKIAHIDLDTPQKNKFRDITFIAKSGM